MTTVDKQVEAREVNGRDEGLAERPEVIEVKNTKRSQPIVELLEPQKKKPRVTIIFTGGCRWCTASGCNCDADEEEVTEEQKDTSKDPPLQQLQEEQPPKPKGLFGITDEVLVGRIFVKLPWLSLLIVTSSCKAAVEEKSEMIAMKLKSFSEISARGNAAVANMRQKHDSGAPLTPVQLALIFKLEWETQAYHKLAADRIFCPQGPKGGSPWSNVLKKGHIFGSMRNGSAAALRLTQSVGREDREKVNVQNWDWRHRRWEPIKGDLTKCPHCTKGDFAKCAPKTPGQIHAWEWADSYVSDGWGNIQVEDPCSKMSRKRRAATRRNGGRPSFWSRGDTSLGMSSVSATGGDSLSASTASRCSVM